LPDHRSIDPPAGLVRARGRSLDGRWNRRARCATDMPTERGPCVHFDASTSSSPRYLWILVAAARGRPMRQCARLRRATVVGAGHDPCRRSRLAPVLESLLRSPARRSRQ
jgi:hypothetical protein